MYTGAIRLIKHDHYLMSLRTSHLIEILSQTIPLLIIQTMNENLLSKTQTIGSLLIAFSILNIINAVAEIFLDSHILRQKTSSIAGFILCKSKSQVKEILLAIILGALFTIVISVSTV